MDDVVKNNINISDILLFDKDYSKEEIFANLKNDETPDFIKIFSIIHLDKITSQNEFNILINNLINHPTPLREIVSIKLEEINRYNKDFFLDESINETIIKSIIDINPNVCRAICNIIQDNKQLREKLEEKIIKEIFKLLEDIKNYEKENKDYFNNDAQRNTKNHAKNKKLFSLYWYLESLSVCLSEKYNSQVLEILNVTIDFADYTIREKTAKILAKMGKTSFELLQKAKQDQNFYVKYQVYDKIDIEN